MSFVTKLSRRTISITLTLLLLILSPLLIVLLLPFYIRRSLARHLNYLFCPQHGKMLTAMANIFAQEYPAMFKTRTKCNLFVIHFIDGQLDIQNLRQHFQNAVIKIDSCGQKSYPYPELVQTITSWMGCLFWTWDQNFQIENHVNLYTGPGKVDQVTEDDLIKIVAQETYAPFQAGRSPWEILIWNNARLTSDPQQRSKCFGIFRCHHSLADGYSILQVLLEEFIGEKLTVAIPQRKKRDTKKDGFCQFFYKGLRFLVRAPFDVIDVFLQSWDFNEWHLSKRQLKGRLVGTLTPVVPVEMVKEIKKIHGCGFNAVLHAAIAGGIRNFMLDHEIKIPTNFHCLIPLPIKQHPTMGEDPKLRNHMTIIFAPLPLKVSDPRDRIRFIEKSFLDLKKSAAPMAFYYLLPALGSLPIWMIRRIPLLSTATALLSNFPGPSAPVKVLGNPLEAVVFYGGLLTGNIGIGASSLSYNGGLRFVAGADEAIIKSPELAKELADKIVQELTVLRGVEIV